MLRITMTHWVLTHTTFKESAEISKGVSVRSMATCLGFKVESESEKGFKKLEKNVVVHSYIQGDGSGYSYETRL